MHHITLVGLQSMDCMGASLVSERPIVSSSQGMVGDEVSELRQEIEEGEAEVRFKENLGRRSARGPGKRRLLLSYTEVLLTSIRNKKKKRK